MALSREHLGLLCGVCAALVNAILAVLIKLCSELPNETMVFCRFFFGFLVLLGFYAQGKIQISTLHFFKHFTRAILGLLSIYLYYYALKRLPLANAIALANTMPLFTPFVILIWLRLLVSKWRFVVAGIGFIGVLLMLNPSQITWELASFAALGTGFFGSIVLVGIRQLSKIESTGVILFYYFGLATVVSFFPCLYFWEQIAELKFWIYLFCMGMLAIFFQYLMTLAFSLAPASKAGVTTYLAIVFGGLLGWWLWGEMPSYWAIAGMILTILGGILSIFDKAKPKKI